MTIKTTMSPHVIVGDSNSVSYMKDGEWLTEPRSQSWASNPVQRLNEEPAPAATFGGYERTEVHFGYEDSADAAIRKEGEFIQARLRELSDKDGKLKPENFDRAVALSARLEQLNQTREADAKLRTIRAQREARGQASAGGLLYEANDKGGTVTVFHPEPTAQDQFNALVKQIDANRRG